MVTLASYFTTQVSCEGAGGTWASHSVTTPDVCRVNGRDFSLRNASPAVQAETDACGAAGGTYIPSSTNTVNYCDVSAVTCGDVGGTSYSVNTLSGSFVSQNIVAGTNRVAADPTEVATTLGLFNGVFDLDNTNLNLVSMTATFTIDHKWDASVVMSPSVYNLMSSAVELNVSSPAATNSYISVESSSVVLYYH
jgi:hypothetical protein